MSQKACHYRRAELLKTAQTSIQIERPGPPNPPPEIVVVGIVFSLKPEHADFGNDETHLICITHSHHCLAKRKIQKTRRVA